jgi:DNA-binding CsgD family transcriptional regulator
MRFRLGRLEDLLACHRMVLADGGLRAKKELWDALPAVWEKMIRTRPAGVSFAVYESDEDDDVTTCGFGMSAFVTEAFYREERSRPKPFIAARFYERHEQVLLGGEDVRQANTDGQLHLLVLHALHRHPDLAHPETRRMMPIAAQSFYFLHAGYRLQSVTGEAYGSDFAAFLAQGGYTQLSDFPEYAEEQRRPYLLGLDRAAVRPAGTELSLQLFHPEGPVFFFTAAEQRVLLHALLGLSDRQVAAELDVSLETVRSAWDSIYTRVGRARPRLLHGADVAASPAARGVEKRRQLLDYLRQHMEELRPMNRPQ